jgi:hypothetical protein
LRDAVVDRLVDEWHRDTGGKELHEHLGITLEEFGRWITDPAGSLTSTLWKQASAVPRP